VYSSYILHTSQNSNHHSYLVFWHLLHKTNCVGHLFVRGYSFFDTNRCCHSRTTDPLDFIEVQDVLSFISLVVSDSSVCASCMVCMCDGSLKLNLLYSSELSPTFNKGVSTILIYIRRSNIQFAHAICRTTIINTSFIPNPYCIR
jgi:hypothetical protein